MPAMTDLDERIRRRSKRYKLLNNDTYAAMALAAATIVALVWANIGTSYESVWSTEFGLSLGGHEFSLTLHEWVDEGLMAFFFFMVGLDVRRELTMGELREKERAILPVLAAIGGLVLPALLFLALTHGESYAHAWGAVISTDTAFALGMLTLVGPRNAPRLKVFLLALAVIDDIGALLVIAFVYTEEIHFLPLLVAAAALIGVYVMQRLGVWRAAPYAVLGVITWFAVFEAGVHATLAGVLVALLMPVYPTRRRDLALTAVAFRLFRQAPAPHVAASLQAAVTHAIPLNQRLSTALPPFVNYFVVPAFALANAGVAISADSLSDAFTSKLTAGIVIALVFGKLIGITALSTLVQRLMPASRLPGVDGPRITGVAGLSGMGFTISLLVASMALPAGPQQDEARIGIISASLLALVLGWIIFAVGNRVKPLDPPAGAHLARPVDPARDHVRGPQDAPVTVVVYGAMSHHFRRNTSSALRDIRARYGDTVRFVFRHRAETPEEVGAAYALEAAAAQGKFWEMYDAFISSPKPIDRDGVLALFERVGIDAEEAENRIEQAADASHVNDDTLDVDSMDLETEIPVVYVDGERVEGPLNSVSIMEAVESNPACRAVRA